MLFYSAMIVMESFFKSYKYGLKSISYDEDKDEVNRPKISDLEKTIQNEKCCSNIQEIWIP